MMSLPRSVKRGRRVVTRVFSRSRSGGTHKANCRQAMRQAAARNLLRELRCGDDDDHRHEREVFEDWGLW
jgi:hypothetical protein